MNFWQAKTKLRPTDKMFSKFIRKRDGRCVFNLRCNKTVSENLKGDEEYFKSLTCSHFHGRRKESVRFDPENCDTACRSCHPYLEEHHDEYEAWKIKQLGKRFDLLTLRANTKGNRDDVVTRLYIKKLMEDYGM